MATGYEVQMYRDIGRIANALERMAIALEADRAIPEALARIAECANAEHSAADLAMVVYEQVDAAGLLKEESAPR